MGLCETCAGFTKNPKFCSKSCSAKTNNKKYPKRVRNLHEKKCLSCEVNYTTSHIDSKYCSGNCLRLYMYNDYIGKWKIGLVSGGRAFTGEISNYVKRYIRNKYDNKCARCGWSEINKYTGNVPIEIEHIDGNYLNNSESNLIALCPNCHSLTPTYKGANIGNGRTHRNKKR